MQLLYRINRTGTTVLVVRHDREMVDKMRRRVIPLEEGRLVRDEDAGRLHNDEDPGVRRPRARRDGRRSSTTTSTTSRVSAGTVRLLPHRGLQGAASERGAPLAAIVTIVFTDPADRSPRAGARASVRRPTTSATRSGSRSSSSRTRPTQRAALQRQELVRSRTSRTSTTSRRRCPKNPRGPSRLHGLLDLRAQHEPATSGVQRQGRRPRQPRIRPDGTVAARFRRQAEPISAAIDDVGDREQTQPIREVTSAVKILLVVIAVLLLSPPCSWSGTRSGSRSTPAAARWRSCSSSERPTGSSAGRS